MAILTEWFNNSDVFLAENITKILKHIGINDHTIELEKDKQPPFGLIYSLELVELETLKTYIKTIFGNNFIWSFKSSFRVFILFN